MYRQIEQMMKDYAGFSNGPCLVSVRSLIKTVQSHNLLVRASGSFLHLGIKDVVHVLNQQWRSMGNASLECLAVNTHPEVHFGRTLISHNKQGVVPDSNILVRGYEPVVANYLAYEGNDDTRFIYFSLAKNKFIIDTRARKGAVPLSRIFSPSRAVFKPQKSAKDLQAGIKGSQLDRVLTAIYEKWATFVYPVQVCRGLTQWQADGWSKSLSTEEQNFE